MPDSRSKVKVHVSRGSLLVEIEVDSETGSHYSSQHAKLIAEAVMEAIGRMDAAAAAGEAEDA